MASYRCCALALLFDFCAGMGGYTSRFADGFWQIAKEYWDGETEKGNV